MKKRVSLCLVAVLVLSLVIFTACGSAEPEITKIEMSSLPSTIEYTVGQKFSASGGKIKVIYSDDTDEVLTLTASGVTYTGADTSAAGEKTVTVTYGGKTTTFAITVIAEPEECEHSYSWSTVKKPTLGTTGTVLGTCSDCGDEQLETLLTISESNGYVKTVVTPAGADTFGKANWTYSDTSKNISFTTSTRIDPAGASAAKFECEHMSLVNGSRKVQEAGDNSPSGGYFVGYMSGASQSDRGFSLKVNASKDTTAMYMLCVGGRKNTEINFANTYVLTVSNGLDAAQTVTVDPSVVFPKVYIDNYDWQEVDIVTIELKAGLNTITVMSTGKTGTNFDYAKIVSTATVTEYYEE